MHALFRRCIVRGRAVRGESDHVHGADVVRKVPAQERKAGRCVAAKPGVAKHNDGRSKSVIAKRITDAHSESLPPLSGPGILKRLRYDVAFSNCS